MGFAFREFRVEAWGLGFRALGLRVESLGVRGASLLSTE